MKSMRTGLFVTIGWIVSLAIAYFVGWTVGVKNTVSVGASAAHSGFSIIVGLVVIVALVVAVAAFRARGYLDQLRNTPHNV
jgi:hypothetical protein